MINIDINDKNLEIALSVDDIIFQNCELIKCEIYISYPVDYKTMPFPKPILLKGGHIFLYKSLTVHYINLEWKAKITEIWYI